VGGRASRREKWEGGGSLPKMLVTVRMRTRRKRREASFAPFPSAGGRSGVGGAPEWAMAWEGGEEGREEGREGGKKGRREGERRKRGGKSEGGKDDDDCGGRRNGGEETGTSPIGVQFPRPALLPHPPSPLPSPSLPAMRGAWRWCSQWRGGRKGPA